MMPSEQIFLTQYEQKDLSVDKWNSYISYEISNYLINIFILFRHFDHNAQMFIKCICIHFFLTINQYHIIITCMLIIVKK